MAIDPTTPLTPITPATPTGSQPHSVVLQAMARAALANSANLLGELVGKPSADVKTHQTVEQADGAPARDAGRMAAASSSGGGEASAAAPRSSPQDTQMMRVVRTAATDAVSRQAGLAPLMADVLAVRDHPLAPPEVLKAAEILLNRLPRAGEISTPRGLRQAVNRSGVFLEAQLARGGSKASPGDEALEASHGADLKAALLVFKGALSNWLAQAPPRVLAPETAEAGPGLPSEATEVDRPIDAPASGAPPRLQAESPEGRAKPLTPPATSETSPEAEGAGPFSSLEGPPPSLPEGEEIISSTRPPAAAPLAVQEDDVEPRFAAFLASPKAAAPTQPLKPQATVLGLLDLAEAPLSGESAQPSGPTAPAPLAARGYAGFAADPGKPKTPPPPFADGPMAGQRPSVSELPVHAPSEEIVRHLLKGVSGALARQSLMQIASLREVHHDPETGEARLLPARLNLDVPFLTPQGVAVVQFEITRDGGGAGGGVVGPAERTYRVRFSIDIEPLGAVHALVTLTGSRARVSLWAERAETIARLRAGEETLGAALRQAELTPEVAVHSGTPPIRDVRVSGHFVDQAS